MKKTTSTRRVYEIDGPEAPERAVHLVYDTEQAGPVTIDRGSECIFLNLNELTDLRAAINDLLADHERGVL